MFGKQEYFLEKLTTIVDTIGDVASSDDLMKDEKDEFFEYITQNIYSILDSFSKYASDLDEIRWQSNHFISGMLSGPQEKEDDSDEQDN